MFKVFRYSLLFIFFLVIFAGLYTLFLLTSPACPGPRVKEISIEKGMNGRQIVHLLKEENLIRSPLAARFYTHLRGKTLKAGFYRFVQPISTQDVLDTLMRGEVDLVTITIPEGTNRFTMARIFEEKEITGATDFIASSGEKIRVIDLDPDAPNCEGFLFPDTYRFARGIPSDEVVDTLVGRFRSKVWSSMHPALLEKGLNVHTWVIIASLVEAEGQMRRENPIIAGVFYNRLKLGMKLQCDPTVRYALILEGRPRAPLTFSALRIDNPYNTYHYKGLPPGPINNPGEASLRASLAPSSTEYIFFVAKNDGTHAFSSTLAEHVKWVNLYQRGDD